MAHVPLTVGSDEVTPSTAAEPSIHALFRTMVAVKASDLHLSAGVAPMIRLDGTMRPLDPLLSPLAPEQVHALVAEIMPGHKRLEFETRHDTDFAYEVDGIGRFRGNVFLDRRGVGAVFRAIPSKMPTAQELALPDTVLRLCALTKGLVVITGPTGSGKSTTLAALVDYINGSRDDHIITIEDPIEFVHENRRCLVNQREVFTHTESFRDALRAALREDPDVVLVGELRDLETTAIAIETAETGHLVFATLHTTTAASTVDRMIDQFPPEQQAQIRVMLSESLRGVISQTLCRKTGGGRVAALEILMITPAVGNLIREGKTFQIPSMMQTGRALGMTTLNDSLMALVAHKVITAEEAYRRSVDKHGLEAALKRGGHDARFPGAR